MPVTRSSSPTAPRSARASTWRRSISTWASSTTRRTLLTRRRAHWALAGSATEGWTRRTRRLSPSRGGSCSAKRCFSPRADEHCVLVRVIVGAGTVVDLAARIAALDLDRSVADRELAAQPALQVAHHMLGDAERALAHHNVTAERRLVR